jgi:hypothetical protein
MPIQHNYIGKNACYIFLCNSPHLIHVVMNPGTAPDPVYFPIADNLLVFENAASQWSTSNQSSFLNNIPTEQRNQSSVMLYNFQGTDAEQQANVTAIVQGGIKGVYITTQDGYT